MVCEINIMFMSGSGKAWRRGNEAKSRSRQRGWSKITRETHFHITTSFRIPNPRNRFTLLWDIILCSKYSIRSIGILWISSTMSDATLPLPPRSSSAAPVSEGHQRADSSEGEAEFDTSLDQSTDYAAREENSGDSGRTDNKQKRKRTRYGVKVFRSTSIFGTKLCSVQSCTYGQLEFWNFFEQHC